MFKMIDDSKFNSNPIFTSDPIDMLKRAIFNSSSQTIYKISITITAVSDDSIAEEGYAYYLQGTFEVITWLVHFVYVMILLERLTPSIRGKRGALCFFVIVAIVDCLRCKTIITKDLTEGNIFLQKYHVYLT